MVVLSKWLYPDYGGSNIVCAAGSSSFVIGGERGGCQSGSWRRDDSLKYDPQRMSLTDVCWRTAVVARYLLSRPLVWEIYLIIIT